MNSTNGREIQEKVSDNCPKSEPSAVEAYDFRCHVDSVASNTDKTISMIQRVYFGSVVGNEIDEEAIAGEVETECYYTVTLMQLMQDL